MGSTHARILLHVVFATKNRRPDIQAPWRGQLHAYLTGTCCKLEADCLIAGGVEDHVHMLIAIPPTHCVSDLVREIKKASNGWIRESMGVPDFSWQSGYFVISVSPSGVDDVFSYIRDQERHHAKSDFRTEYEALLRKCGIEVDPRDLP
jgi:putative transposase